MTDEDKADEPETRVDPAAEIAALKVQLDEAQLASKRWQAEYVNYQQRMGRERESDRKYALEGLLRDLLPSVDSIQRTQAALAKAQAAASVLKAVELAEKELVRVLARHGVKPLEPREMFDPAVHEAIESVATSDKPEGAIVEVLQAGYFIHERLLRPAMVRVAKP